MSNPHRVSTPSTALATAGVGVALAAALWLYRLAGDQALLTWTFTHWAFTYQHGMVKRALVGELFQWVVPAHGLFDAVSAVAVVLAAVVAVALSVVFWRPWLRWRTPGTFAFGVLATTHVATVQHALYDLGRFDQIGLLLTLLCLTLIVRAGSSAVVTTTVAVVCAVGLLVHEAFLLMFTPLIVGGWLWRTGVGRGWAEPRYVILAGVQIAVLVILTSLGPPDIGEVALVEELAARHGPWIHPQSVHVLYGDATADMSRSLLLLVSVRRIIQHIVLGALLLPTLWLLVAVVREARRLRDEADGAAIEVIFLVSACSPLLLYAVGIDFARWWALALTNVFIALGLLLATSPRWADAMSRVFRRRPAAVWAVLAVNLVAGPLGVASAPFPHLEPVIKATIVTLARAVGA